MQTPGSILLHIDGSARAAERVRLAAQLAETFDAQVSAQPCTLSSLLRYPFAIEAAAEAMPIMQEMDAAARDRMHAVFMANSAGSQRLRWTEAAPDGLWGFARQALYTDLLVLGQRDPVDPMDGELPADFVATLLVESGRPALVLPYAGPVGPVGNNVLIAWKETREAARAVTAALPWLRRASQVHAVAYGEDAAPTLASLHGYLSTHAVSQVTLHAGGAEEGDVGGKLLSLAADLGSDLLVMGCYGHSRAREWVLGGATMSMLQSMTVPVLMSH